MQLIIGNKRYSSWSLRPWLVMTQFGLPFEETLIQLDTPTFAEEVRRYSPSGRVPCLIDGEIAVWETLAIIEYLAERFPEHAIWPRDKAARAVARAISNEMHAGLLRPEVCLPDEPAPQLCLQGSRRGGREGCRPHHRALARCAKALRRGRTVPLWRVFGSRCHVCARGFAAYRLQLAARG